MFYVLPLRAAAEQIFYRAVDIFNCDNNNRVGILHSDADVFLISDDENENSIKLYETSNQLSLAVNIASGDQFFPYALKPPGYEKIYSTFSYSKLVVDEIQAYDPKASAIAIKFAEDIARLGGNILLMSATFPDFIKVELLQRSKKYNLLEPEIINIYEENKNDLLKLKKHKICLVKIKNKILEDKKIDFSFSENLIKKIAREAKTKRVLVVCNTINQAISVYNKILNFKDYRIDAYLLHSWFSFYDRKKI